MSRRLVSVAVAVLLFAQAAGAEVVIDFEDLKRQGSGEPRTWTLQGVSAEARAFIRQYVEVASSGGNGGANSTTAPAGSDGARADGDHAGQGGGKN